MVDEASRPFYTITEGYKGKFALYYITPFEADEIEGITQSIREDWADKPAIYKVVQKVICNIDENRKIIAGATLACGYTELEFQQFDTIKSGETCAYNLIGKIRRTSINMQDPEDGINLNLFYPGSIVMLHSGLIEHSAVIRYVIPNITNKDFAQSQTAEYIEALDQVYPKINHPYACLYGLLPEVFESYRHINCYRPNYIR